MIRPTNPSPAPPVRSGSPTAGFAVLSFCLTTSALAALPVSRVPTPLRDVRVLIADAVKRLQVESDGIIDVRDDDGEKLAEIIADSPVDIRPGRGFAIAVGDGPRAEGALLLEPESGQPIRLSVYRKGEFQQLGIYEGSLRIISSDGNGLDVINHVDVEDYVAGVVAAEAWPTFHDQALRGQAIVSRTFVIYHMTRDPYAEIDLSATQGAQVYRGIRSDSFADRVNEAVEFTRGVILVYNDGEKDHIFCAYYSAACGGRSQSAAPFGSENDVPPLRGNVRCDYCKIAPGDTYRWGPVRMSLASVQKKLAGRYEKIGKLGRITSMTVSARTETKRPLVLRITGSTGDTLDLLAENVRHVLGPSIIKSTDFHLRIDGHDVVFENGRGFGHGLGLCQWGMEGQARLGRHAGEILRFYYPTARLVRVY